LLHISLETISRMIRDIGTDNNKYGFSDVRAQILDCRGLTLTQIGQQLFKFSRNEVKGKNTPHLLQILFRLVRRTVKRADSIEEAVIAKVRFCSHLGESNSWMDGHRKQKIFMKHSSVGNQQKVQFVIVELQRPKQHRESLKCFGCGGEGHTKKT